MALWAKWQFMDRSVTHKIVYGPQLSAMNYLLNIIYRRIFSSTSTTSAPKSEAGSTGTCFIQKIYAPSSSLLQGKHLPYSPSPLRVNIFRLFVILSLTQPYRYTPRDISLFDCHI